MKVKYAVVTLGATHEAIDPVRFLGNRSSGKQGLAIIKTLLKKDVQTIAICGVVDSDVRRELEILATFNNTLQMITVTTALEMLTATQAAVAKRPQDVMIGVAAVCDFRPENPLTHKLKHQQGESLNDIKFVQNPDIIATIASSPQRPKLVVAFAAETDNLLVNARKKLIEKNCDIIIANNVAGGKVMSQDTNAIFILSGKDRMMNIPESDKTEIAKHICEYIWRFNLRQK